MMFIMIKLLIKVGVLPSLRCTHSVNVQRCKKIKQECLRLNQFLSYDTRNSQRYTFYITNVCI